MRRAHGIRLATSIVLGLLAVPAPAKADRFGDIAFGLGYAGFDLEGSRNVLSGGADFRISRNLVGLPLDFGSYDLTLQGPISFEFSTGGRELSNLEITFQTAMTSRQVSQPLSYVFNADVGGQATQVNGSILIDGSLSLNGFGFYDLQIDYSSRQSVERGGRFSNSEDTFDFDLGPIQVRGNIFADALALITAPAFDAAGAVNPFDSFSGRVALNDALRARGNGIFDLEGSGVDPLADTVARAFASQDREPIAGLDESPGAGARAGAIPEPAILLLMLLGLPFVVRRYRTTSMVAPGTTSR